MYCLHLPDSNFDHVIPKHIDCFWISPSPDVHDELFSVLYLPCWRSRPDFLQCVSEVQGEMTGIGPLTAFSTPPSFSSPYILPQVSPLLLYFTLSLPHINLLFLLLLQPCPSSLPLRLSLLTHPASQLIVPDSCYSQSCRCVKGRCKREGVGRFKKESDRGVMGVLEKMWKWRYKEG